MQQITKILYSFEVFDNIYLYIYDKCTENQYKSLIKYTRRRLTNNTSSDIFITMNVYGKEWDTS